MLLADEQVVRAALADYEGVFFRAFQDAWEDWRSLSLGGRLVFPSRTRACIVYDFAVQRVMAAVDGDANIYVIRRNETIKFVFGNTVALRLKKANEQGLGSNIETQATLDFVWQQEDLPGIPNVHKVEVVYTLNTLQTRIEQVSVVARDGQALLWSYDINPEQSANVVMLPTSPPPQDQRRAQVKLRNAESIDKGEQKKPSEK